MILGVKRKGEMQSGIRKPAKTLGTPTPRRKKQQQQQQQQQQRVSASTEERQHQLRQQQQQGRSEAAMDMFASPKRVKNDDLEVTGISRSGRVRKKSSKLVDFESPDDIADNKYKRQKAAQQLQAQQQLLERYDSPQPQPAAQQAQASPPMQPQQPPQQPPPQQQSGSAGGGGGSRPRKNSGSTTISAPQKPLKVETSSENEGPTSSESDDQSGLNEDERYSMESGSDDEVDPLMIDDRETGFRKLEPPGQETASSQANSLYMLEKCKKKLIIKDGKIIGRMKAQRKDKGKTRFTAYMLWAKEVRQELLEQYPYMDFAQISKRLGELWATVPNLEKYNWRRRAKRLAAKPNSLPASKDEPVWKMPPPASRKKFINKIGNGKEARAPAASPRKTIQLGVPSVVGSVPVSPPTTNRTSSSSSATTIAASKDTALINEQPMIGTGMYKVVGTQPIDVAAHLKLLGESLTIIGERLKEHDGQIAVSGSLSVLLDSLLCALGPLICLTQQVPETNGAKHETLSQMLDNIAYLMPGL